VRVPAVREEVDYDRPAVAGGRRRPPRVTRRRRRRHRPSAPPDKRPTDGRDGRCRCRHRRFRRRRRRPRADTASTGGPGTARAAADSRRARRPQRRRVAPERRAPSRPQAVLPSGGSGDAKEETEHLPAGATAGGGAHSPRRARRHAGGADPPPHWKGNEPRRRGWTPQPAHMSGVGRGMREGATARGATAADGAGRRPPPRAADRGTAAAARRAAAAAPPCSMPCGGRCVMGEAGSSRRQTAAGAVAVWVWGSAGGGGPGGEDGGRAGGQVGGGVGARQRRGGAACDSVGGTPLDGPVDILDRGTLSRVGRIRLSFIFTGRLIGAAMDPRGWSRKRERPGQTPHRRAAACLACPPRPVTYPTALSTLLVVATLPRSPPPCCFSIALIKSTALLPAFCGPRTGDAAASATVWRGAPPLPCGTAAPRATSLRRRASLPHVAAISLPPTAWCSWMGAWSPVRGGGSSVAEPPTAGHSPGRSRCRRPPSPARRQPLAAPVRRG